MLLFPLISAFLLSDLALAGKLHPRLDNGLALTPPLGWNSYNHYSCSPNQSIIESNAQALVDFGLADVGYHYVTTDCGWSLPNRTANGTLPWNPDRFPDGLPAVGEFIHSLGLGFGVYGDGGIQMCMTGEPAQAGSLGHETTDAQTFKDWDADLLKYDNCYSDAASGYPDAQYTPSTSPSGHYVTMHNAIRNVSWNPLFQICEWGVDFPSAWAPALGNSWRTTNDIIPAWRTISRIINQNVPQTDFAGPGQWLDLDMLEVGNNIFTEAEEQTHFSLWSIIKSPLVIGGALNDTLTTISDSSLAILKNKDILGYNQDSLGVAASFRRRWTEDGYEVWSGPLSDNGTVAALVNWQNSSRELTLDLPDVGLQSASSLKDIWNGVQSDNVLTSYTAIVAAHGVMLVELADTTAAGFYDAAAFSETNGSITTFSNVYGETNSANYSLTIFFSAQTTSATSLTYTSSASNSTQMVEIPASASSITVPISLLAASTNTISLAGSLTIASINVSAPAGTYYPSTSFTATGGAELVTCVSGFCEPVGSKIGDISPNGTAVLSITNPSNGTSTTAKFVAIDFCNNDVALSTSWTTGTNTRNLTVSVNGLVTRVEVPLSGRHSELFGETKGWQDTGTFGVLLDGFGGSETGVDEVVVGNEGGAEGVQSWGADFVGLRVFW